MVSINKINDGSPKKFFFGVGGESDAHPGFLMKIKLMAMPQVNKADAPNNICAGKTLILS